MKRIISKKLGVSLQAYAPWVASTAMAVRDGCRQWRHIPHAAGFRGLSFFNAGRDSLFLDVGGNAGQAVSSIRMRAPHSPIISYEPNTAMALKIKRKFRRDPNVKVETCAIGSQRGRFSLHVPVYRGVEFPALATLDRTTAEEWLVGRLYGYRPEALSIKEITCPVRTIDDLGLRPFMIKVDCCCVPLEVIRGGAATIADCRPFLILESVQYEGELKALLAPLGYQMYSYDPSRHALRETDSDPGDSYFISRERRHEVAQAAFGNW